MASKRKAAPSKGPPGANTKKRAGAPAKLHSWKTRPDEKSVLEHVLAFTDALATLDLDAAFQLCPVLEKKKLLTPKDEPKWFAKNLPDVLLSYADPLNFDDPRDLDAATRDAWLRSLRQPRKLAARARGFAMPAVGDGEVRINLAVGGEVGNLIARFTLTQIDKDWMLCFSDIDMP